MSTQKNGVPPDDGEPYDGITPNPAAGTPAAGRSPEAELISTPKSEPSATFSLGSPQGGVGVIPVGHEPPRLNDSAGKNGETAATVARGESQLGEATAGAARRGGGIRKSTTSPEEYEPQGRYAYTGALEEVRVFRMETMRGLRRAELNVWNAIHNCQSKSGARISQERIMELGGIKSKRHVSAAVQSLRRLGLLEVLQQGRYRGKSAVEHGLASIYRVYPRPEPRLVAKAAAADRRRAEH